MSRSPLSIPGTTAPRQRQTLGYGPVWFGMLFNLSMQIAYLSPPFGRACSFLKGVAPPDVTMEEILASCWPWMGLQLIGVALVMALPEIALRLPRDPA